MRLPLLVNIVIAFSVSMINEEEGNSTRPSFRRTSLCVRSSAFKFKKPEFLVKDIVIDIFRTFHIFSGGRC